MIFIAVTKTRKKLNFIIKVTLLLLLIAFLIPSLYGMIVEVNAPEQFSGGENLEEYPGEPMRVNGEAWKAETRYWEDIAVMLGGIK